MGVRTPCDSVVEVYVWATIEERSLRSEWDGESRSAAIVRESSLQPHEYFPVTSRPTTCHSTATLTEFFTESKQTAATALGDDRILRERSASMGPIHGVLLFPVLILPRVSL